MNIAIPYWYDKKGAYAEILIFFMYYLAFIFYKCRISRKKTHIYTKIIDNEIF